MSAHPPDQDPLEHAIHGTLRALPLQRAPRSLEQRVVAALSRRAALPWWRKSFAHWPMAARGGFLVMCLGLVKAAFSGSAWIATGFELEKWRVIFSGRLSWLQDGVAVAQAVADFADIILRNIPVFWLYASVGVVAITYALIVGVGAAAYKALQTH